MTDNFNIYFRTMDTLDKKLYSFIDENKLSDLEKILKYKFENKNLIANALLHSSFVNKNNFENIKSNERLEFLGDSVISLVFNKCLFEKFPDYSEKQLSKLLSKLESRETLNNKALKLSFDKYLYYDNINELPDDLLGNMLEAVIGAVFLDSNYDTAAEVVKHLFTNELSTISFNQKLIDPKTYLQEYFLKNHNKLPEYKMVNTIGKEHEQQFITEVYFENKLLGSGKDTTKKKSEKQAAKSAITFLKI